MNSLYLKQYVTVYVYELRRRRRKVKVKRWRRRRRRRMKTRGRGWAQDKHDILLSFNILLIPPHPPHGNQDWNQPVSQWGGQKSPPPHHHPPSSSSWRVLADACCVTTNHIRGRIHSSCCCRRPPPRQRRSADLLGSVSTGVAVWEVKGQGRGNRGLMKTAERGFINGRQTSVREKSITLKRSNRKWRWLSRLLIGGALSQQLHFDKHKQEVELNCLFSTDRPRVTRCPHLEFRGK